MSLIENYLSKVGMQTATTMKVVLVELLESRFQTEYDSEFASTLAAAVANHLFCQSASNPEFHAFAKENHVLIEEKARKLSTEEPLCRALTCAVYNFCYGKYVDSGRKVGMFSHPFLGYIRALQEVRNGKEPLSFLASFASKAGEQNVEPLLNLFLLGLYRPLPRTPDSKLTMDQVVAFAQSARSTLKNSSEPTKDASASAQRRP